MTQIKYPPIVYSDNWWSKLDYQVKVTLSVKHYGDKRIMGSLTKGEIQYIYLKEKDNSTLTNTSIQDSLYTIHRPLQISKTENGYASDFKYGQEFVSKQVAEELYNSLMAMWAEFNSTKGTRFTKETVARAQDILDKYSKK